MTTTASSTQRAYAAMYGAFPCRAYTSDGRWFSVHLSRDPGYGSMLYTRIHRSEITLLAEIDLSTRD